VHPLAVPHAVRILSVGPSRTIIRNICTIPVMLTTGLVRLSASVVPPINCGHKVSILRPAYCAAKVKDFNLSCWEMLVLDPPECREWSA
jgi:hypothetical protein